ncbi:hypothetical protein Hypma_001545 [Hypsizygus marmoreus]|uniref:DUF8040 domain-containing protein n=1 Tax=Hypsizygus marmoreus TaxID=39966 RepID=A0A369K3E0_HYPMA|nr:hypothetical protein Hypma_001545 [Hypsizygus marmoreus]
MSSTLTVQQRQMATAAALFVVNTVAFAAHLYAASFYIKTPYHTSALTGAGWVHELMTGHPDRIKMELGMHLHVFCALVDELRGIGIHGTYFVTLEEQVAIFFYTCVTGLSIWHVGERFQHANATISRCFLTVLFAVSSPPFYDRYVKLLTTIQPVPSHILNNPKFFPFFSGAIGAMDGSHFNCCPSAQERHLA